MAGFRDINVNALGAGLGEGQSRLRSLSRGASLGLDAAASPLAGLNDEAAARLALQTYLEDAGDPGARDLTAPDRPELVPDFRLRQAGTTPDLGASTITYQQSARAIPVFGARVTVDLDEVDRALVAINGRVADAPPAELNALATLSAAEALARLRAWGGSPPADAPDAPALNWWLDEAAERWRLVYRFAGFPMIPPGEPVADDAPAPCGGHGLEPSAYDYFVDAHDGEVVYFFSSAPHLDIPSPMTGVDVNGRSCDFFGLKTQAGYSLIDPTRGIETYDYAGQDLDRQPLPSIGKPIVAAAHDAGISPAAVSAHHNAMRVWDFFNNELRRKSIDDKGMKLVSVVNVWSTRGGGAKPVWPNAAFWRNTMWYGGTQENGEYRSWARFLDVIGHELTHGVVASSSALVYRDLSGALNKSFADIFGVMIANWQPGQPEPLAGWDWRIGPGLGRNGGPLRDFADPAAAGQPAHMNQYVKLPANHDSGGVHIYSGIHNKAAHGVIQALGARDAALLYYLTLTRLTPTSAFRECRRTLEAVAGVYYRDHLEGAARLGAIAAAYDAVGIAA